MIFVLLEMTSLLAFKLSTTVDYMGVSLEYHIIVVVVVNLSKKKSCSCSQDYGIFILAVKILGLCCSWILWERKSHTC